MLERLKRRLKGNFPGISWQDPRIRRVLPLLDFLDSLLRRVSGRGYLPQYSVRIRSTGIGGQVGGREFVESGADMVSLIRSVADITPETSVLEIGCGAGRTAFALVEHLKYGQYTGIDVDRVSIDACKHNPVLAKAGFHFLYTDVISELYNPEGQTTASDYVFPFSKETFDIAFLHSVFTHMLPQEVARYIEEIARVLRPGGRCIFSTFLTDLGIGQGTLSFPYDYGSYRLHQEQTPRKAVAYTLNYFDTVCSQLGVLQREVLLSGTWRRDSSMKPDTHFYQDILVLAKRN